MRTEGSPLSHEGTSVPGSVGNELASFTTEINGIIQCYDHDHMSIA